jgi:hypothetical protein
MTKVSSTQSLLDIERTTGRLLIMSRICAWAANEINYSVRVEVKLDDGRIIVSSFNLGDETGEHLLRRRGRWRHLKRNVQEQLLTLEREALLEARQKRECLITRRRIERHARTRRRTKLTETISNRPRVAHTETAWQRTRAASSARLDAEASVKDKKVAFG